MDGKVKKFAPFAPFEVIKEEKSYLLWLAAVVFFSAPELWKHLLAGYKEGISNLFLSGYLYTFSIAFCAPFISSILIQFITKKRSHKENHFFGYKIASILIAMIFIVVCLFLTLGIHRSEIVLQVIIALISIALAFYMYCIGEMEIHDNLVQLHNDRDYHSQEKKQMQETQERAKSLLIVEGDVEI